MDSTDAGRAACLKRTLSASNVNAARQIHEFIKVQQEACKDQIPTLNRDVTKSSMILPEQYNLQTLQLCIDLKCLHVLESERYLNWCTDCRLLLPLQVECDGNSLLHSLSLYMFGVHDRQLVLRQLLYQRLFMETSKGLLRSRWMVHNDTRTGMTWNKVIEMASDKVQPGPLKYTQLTSIHIFTMANILARPIIVCCSNVATGVSDTSVGGVYLPLLRGTTECEKSPIILGYENGHFVPLISSENLNIPVCKNTPTPDAYHCIPLVDANFSNLHLNFLLPKEGMGDKPVMLRNSYLDVINISQRMGNTQKIIDAAMLKFKTPPAFSIELMWSLEQFALNTNQPAMHAGRVNQVPAMQAGNEIRDQAYTHMQGNDTDDNIYESLILCAQHGCQNNVSSKNNMGFCMQCYQKVLQENATRMRDTPANPDVIPHTRQVAIGNQANVVPSSAQPMKCRSPNCPYFGQPHMNGKCTSCFKADEESNKNNDVKFRPTVADRAYDAVAPPRPTPRWNNTTKENNLDVGSDYDKLDNFDVQKFNNIDVQNAPTYDYDQLNAFNAQNVRRPTDIQNVRQPKDENGYLLPQPVMSTSGYQDPYNAMGKNSQANNVATGFQKSNEGAGHHNEGAAQYDAGPKDSIRSKVLCNVAGCINSIGKDGQRCNEHNPDTPQQYNICVMKGCNNSAEYNDNFLCMVCFQSQKHVVREHDVIHGPPPVSKRNEGAAAYDLKSMANELPPIPTQPISQASPYPQSPFHITPPSVKQPQPRFQNMTNVANVNMFGQNMPEIPGIPPNIPNIPNIPEIPNIPFNHNIPGNPPNIPGAAGGSAMGSNFTPPTAYGGFEGFGRNVGGSQNATLNWQKGGAAATKCIHCDNHANPDKEGLCNECWRQKELGIKQDEPHITNPDQGGVAKCINEDCDGKGSERFNYLCEQCYKKQLDAMSKHQKKGGGEPVAPDNTYVDVNIHRTNQMNYGNYDMHNQMDYGNADKNNQMNYGNYDRNNQVDYMTANRNNQINYGGDPNHQVFVNPDFQQQQMHLGNMNYDAQQQMHPGNQQQQMHPGNVIYEPPTQQIRPGEINPALQQQQQQMHYGNNTYGMQQAQAHAGRLNQEQHPAHGPMFVSNYQHDGPPDHVTVNPDHVLHPTIPAGVQGGEVKKTCKGLSCEFFGSEEFGGYCSGCFLNITKKESEKQDGNRTFAPGINTAAARPQDNVPPVFNPTALPPNQTAPAPNQAGPTRCKGAYCQNYGSLQRMGFCSECFRYQAQT